MIAAVRGVPPRTTILSPPAIDVNLRSFVKVSLPPNENRQECLFTPKTL